MSEYQYYEFLAVDTSLTPAQIEEVRRYSSRAEISSTRFSNHYEWGDFKGDPQEFLARYFDLHVYFANWGTHTFALSIPVDAIPLPVLRPYTAESACEIFPTSGRLILTFSSQDEEGDWESSGEEWMAQLAPLREEILAADLRPLYLAWLSAAHEGLLDEDTPEPPLPAGLDQLTASQKSLIDFLRIDPSLVEIAAQNSSPFEPQRPDPAEWLATLSAQDKDSVLQAILDGHPTDAVRNLRARFNRSAPAHPVGASGRTVRELLTTALELSTQRARLRAQEFAREKAEKQARAAAERQEYLRTIAPQRDQLWQKIEQLIASTLPKNYDQALTLLRDLRDLAAASNDSPAFQLRLESLRQRHQKKTTLQKRLRNAAL